MVPRHFRHQLQSSLQSSSNLIAEVFVTPMASNPTGNLTSRAGESNVTRSNGNMTVKTKERNLKPTRFEPRAELRHSATIWCA